MEQSPQSGEGPQRKRRNREHTNSKFGCAQCKARKVKCDETRPNCRNCARRATPCTYVNDRHSSNGLNELARLAASSPHGSAAPLPPPSHPYTSTPNNNFFAQPPPPTPIFHRNTIDFHLGMPHLELLHHFTISTAHSLTTPTILADLWANTIPKIALSHDFLMHALLAVAALHIAHLNPHQSASYHARAIAHSNRALELSHTEMAHPSRENADALFAFVYLNAYYAFTAPYPNPRPNDEGPKPLQGAVQTINLLRSSRGILPAVHEHVESGPLAPLLGFHPDTKSSPTFAAPETDEHFSALLLFCSGAAGGPTEIDDIETFAAAASSLRALYLKMETLPADDANAPPIWHWAVRLPGSVAQRLGEGQTVPLVLVAHWCVLLLRVRRYWWIEGWVERAMREIREVCAEEGRVWLEWPMARVREAGERGQWSGEGGFGRVMDG